MTLQQLKYVAVMAKEKSMNAAAKELFISQPSLSGSIRTLEEELGFDIFFRSSHGISLTPEGEEFTGYARQVLDQYDLLSQRYLENDVKKKFSVSMQHYSFAVKAFIEVIKTFGLDTYEFAVYETKTEEVIENVKNFKSEIGILYVNDFNRNVLTKILRDNALEFTPLFECDTFVYLAKSHPLSYRKHISIRELSDYPCLAFDQGKEGSFFLSEEQLSTYDYKRLIRANDRATMLNLMVGLNAYTLCSGIISEDLNGDGYAAVPLKESEPMTIGYIKRRGSMLNEIGTAYIEKLKEYG